MINAELSLLMYHQRHDEFVQAATRSGLIGKARPPRSPGVRPSRVSVLDVAIGAWRRLTDSRPTAPATDPAVCCA
jgi:hypothetical protein